MKILVEVPEGWLWTNCFVCNGKKLCPASEDGPCPLRHAKEAVEHPTPGVRHYTEDGNPVSLYAVKEDK